MPSAVELLLNGRQFMRLSRSMLAQLSRESGLAPSELDVLLCLLCHPEADTVGELSRLRMTTKSSVSRIVDALAGKGYVRMEEDARDRRVQRLTLTPPGRAAAEQAQALHERCTGLLLRGISPEERETLERLAAQVARNVREALARQPAPEQEKKETVL